MLSLRRNCYPKPSVLAINKENLRKNHLAENSYSILQNRTQTTDI